MSPRITLIGKPGCHLCDDARAVVVAVADETGTEWEERSILDDADLHERYWEQIPVVLVDGRVHDIWRVHEDALRAALLESPGTVPPGEQDGPRGRRARWRGRA